MCNPTDHAVFVLLKFAPEQFSAALDDVSALSRRASDYVVAFGFEGLLDEIPDGKVGGVHVEAGRFDGSTYAFETDAGLQVAPDGTVWAQVADTVDQLPAMQE
jgi:hypothetical protein